MSDKYNEAKTQFYDYVSIAGNCMSLAMSLPPGLPAQIQAEQDAQKFVGELSKLNLRYGFVEGAIVPIVVRSMLAKDSRERVMPTTDNFLKVMQFDPKYKYIRYNLMTDAGETQTEDKDGNAVIKTWSDADEAESRRYIESEYGISNRDKHADALRLLFKNREYNPIIDIIESIEWDGIERCEDFLPKWGKTENTPYAREVSRLIFAGGIWRLYQPGCKFDDVPILIGTKQGEGKSSLIRFLAIHDQYYGECNLFDGNQAIEQLSGKWIVEMSELLALTKTKDVEASKAYITRTFDHYRKPWDRNPVDLPRRCIFLGTTNNAQPLRDVYNRRYYPIAMHTKGYDLFDHEQECRDYILQCWAEARDKYKRHDKSMQNFAKRELVDQYREQQENARQDDWRIGAIESYLETKAAGEFVCIRELTNKALALNGIGHDPTIIESKDIGMIMARFDGWERRGVHYFSEWGKQRAWQKTSADANSKDDAVGLPF